MRSKDHYRLEVRPSTNSESVKQIYDASFFPSPLMEVRGNSEEVPGRLAVDLRIRLAKDALLRLAGKKRLRCWHISPWIKSPGPGMARSCLWGEFLRLTVAPMGMIRESRKRYSSDRIVEVRRVSTCFETLRSIIY
jgi:hypothetical protein